MKKLTAILAVLLIVACLPLSVLAADTATITGANVTAAPGATAEVSFSITEATYATYSMSVIYDSEDLTLTGMTAGKASPANFGFNADNGRFNAAQSDDSKFSGVVATASFAVPADAKVGDVYPVTVEVRNVTNAASEKLDVTVVAGSVTIVCAHGESSWEVTKEPDCTETGIESLICSACGTVLDTREIAALGHQWGEWITESDADCVTDGKECRTCARCGEHECKTLDALGHLPGEAVQENYVAPTQTEDGGYDLVVYCQRCGVELERKHHVIPATGYDDEPNTGDFTVVLGMVAIMVMMIPCMLVSKFRTVK